jgi:hypothetical protein
VYYQGTVCTEVEKARLYGLDPQYKSISSVDFAVVVDVHSPEHEALARKNAKSHYFFTKLKKVDDARLDATTYVNMASCFARRKQAFLRKDEVSLEDDPDSAPENLAFRSGRKIEAGYILRSKKEPAEESLASEFSRISLTRIHRALNGTS